MKALTQDVFRPGDRVFSVGWDGKIIPGVFLYAWHAKVLGCMATYWSERGISCCSFTALEAQR